MLQKSNTFKVLYIFFREPSKRHYLMEVSRRAKLSHTSVKPILERLVKEGILKKVVEAKGKRKFLEFVADYNGKTFRRYKRQYNAEALEESGILDFIYDTLQPQCIVLFGSYSRGEDFEDSDIDLLIECKAEELDVVKYEKTLGRKLQLHFREDFTKSSKELKNNIINGQVVRGFLEGYK